MELVFQAQKLGEPAVGERVHIWMEKKRKLTFLTAFERDGG